MKTITCKQIKSLGPCYYPNEIEIQDDYKDSIINFINDYRNKVKSENDILWVLLRNEFLTDKQLRLFAVWCAKKALKLIDNPDERSLNAIKVAKDYANGKATYDERSAAWSAAWSVAESARSAAESAVRSAAESAAWSAARSEQIDKLVKIFKTGKVSFNDLKD